MPLNKLTQLITRCRKKYAVKMVLGKACITCQTIQADSLVAVVMNILSDLANNFCVFVVQGTYHGFCSNFNNVY